MRERSWCDVVRLVSRATLAVMAELLIVDDDPAIRRMLERTLAAEGYRVQAVSDGGAALAAVERSLPDLLVLDVAMPGLDGLAVAQRLRSKGLSVPILFLTARDAVSDRVAGFEAGGDDYLVKPFAVAELLVRVRALLRRGRELGRELAHRDLRLDPFERRAVRGGREIELTGRESALLGLLLGNVGRTVTRGQALAVVWSERAAMPSVVDRYVAYLRRKLGEPPLIETVRGVGFRIPR
jgi:two-component system response regulator MprA